ncbi:MAG: histidine kinase [Eggerthellaceae bacterium]|nr:histidine kinase [Eggerthellaceae bacterium]
MINWQDVIYVFVNGAVFMLSALGLYSAVVSPSLDRWEKRFFIIFFADLVACTSVFFLELAVIANPAMTILLKLAFFLDSLLISVPFPMLAVYLLYCCGEDWRKSSLFRVVFALWATYLIMVIISQFTTVFYSVTPDNQLQLGPLYPLSVAPVLTILLIMAAGVIGKWDRLPEWHGRAFVICLLPITLAVFVHLFSPTYALVDIGLAISTFSMYRIIENASAEQLLRHQREIARQRASIAVLQMRPHFIYNTLTSVYYLCDQDPKAAQRVIKDFTTYLRKNFTAIASENAIPFTDELEHTHAYLAVEQAQFEDALVVDFDTPHTLFRMPPLTLQPIVENAVKHGMDPDSGPLHILVRTEKVESDSVVVVEDDGAGCDPAVADDPKTTLANIRQRLDMMCGGTLSIEPREGGGTVVKLTIPHRE